MNLPSAVSRLFSDLGRLKPNPIKDSTFIIERVLKLGDLEAISWMLKTYPKKQINKVATSSRELTKRDISFWSLVLSIPKEKFLWTSQF